ncbi:MAG TPA: hypothetical protein VIM57_04860 [Luteolibacter sp.]
MNLRLLALLLAWPLPSTLADDVSDGVIRFANQNQLTGTLDSLSLDRLIWNSPQLEHPAPFLLDQVLDVTLPAELPELKADHDAILTLTNGDILRGQLSSVTDQTIELDTWYGGRLTIKRPMVASLKITGRPKLYYRGPDSLDGWEQTTTGDRKAWQYENRSFRSNASGGLGRDLHLPDQCRISFDLAWRSSLRLRLMIFSDNAATDSPQNTYELGWQRRYAEMRKRTGGNNRSAWPILGQAHVPESAQNEKAHIDLYCDRAKGLFNFVVDGRSIALWNDPDPKQALTGGCLHFISEDSSPLRISRLEVSGWNGVVENLPEDEDLNAQEQRELEAKTEAEAEKTGGLMKLRNGDVLAGDVLAIRNGVMKVKTSFGEINLPVSRLRTIALKPSEYDEAKWNRGDIRGWLPDGGRVTFRLDEATGKTLTGFSQNFGSATFKADAFNKLEFNIYNSEFEAGRKDSEW